jgi:hypothetical protein
MIPAEHVSTRLNVMRQAAQVSFSACHHVCVSMVCILLCLLQLECATGESYSWTADAQTSRDFRSKVQKHKIALRHCFASCLNARKCTFFASKHRTCNTSIFFDIENVCVLEKCTPALFKVLHPSHCRCPYKIPRSTDGKRVSTFSHYSDEHEVCTRVQDPFRGRQHTDRTSIS